MKSKLSKFFLGLLLVVSLTLLALTNTGILSFDTPYIYKLSNEISDIDPLVAFVNVGCVEG